MPKVIADISISLDGYVTGPHPGLANGLGDGGEGLHTWAFSNDAVDQAVLSEGTGATGVIVMGRTLFDLIDSPGGWNDEVGYGAGEVGLQPVLVVTRTPPERMRLPADRFTFVADGIGSAVAKATAMADDRHVVIMGGGRTVRGALELGLLDELHLHLAPVILGGGTPLFDGGSPRTLRQFRVRHSAHATHLSYRVD
ncbi:dihydrofolate reductase family protein [Actinoplanes sp. NPDC049265]|uniref:dihydrofolate reductase family protein n=1 Tax=Actinoplanes sp. NPDC049265 TaxID=3363902 RepID=UPI003719C021